MINQTYWQQRFAELEYANNQKAQKVFTAELIRAFDKAEAELNKEIAAWLMRFAVNNGLLSITEARKLLNAAELKELKWDVEEYIAKGRENAFTAAWVKELENASAKFHISRLEALKLHIRQYLETAFGTEHKVLTETMNGIYENTYYHTCFEVQHGFNIGWNIGQVDERQLDKVVNSPWAPDGRDFSDRIWTAKEKMVNELQQQITQDLLLGRAPDEAINTMTKYLKEKTHNAKVNAGRLVMTEEAFVASAAQRDAFKDLGVEEYEIVATLDSHTSAICQEMDGKHFPMKDYQPGTTAPPFHAYCRSVTVPYFDDEWARDGQRADSDDCQTFYMPEDMTYHEWKETSEKRLVITNWQNRDILKSGAVSGGRNPYGEKANEHAVRYYAAVRKMTTDVDRIAKTTNRSVDEIQTIKNYIFMDKHNLGGEFRRFDPDYMMAESWRRLIDGKPEPHDLTLINHELMEKAYIEHGISQEQAHKMTSRIYNYSKEANEYYGRMEKFRKD